MFVMQDLRFRILTLCVVPFLIGSGLVLLTAITSLQSQTEQAERQLAETLLVHKAPDAALYLATEDWVALAVILDQLTQATGLGRAEVLNRDNQLLLASGKAPALRAQYTAPLRHEGLLIGSLSLIVQSSPPGRLNSIHAHPAALRDHRDDDGTGLDRLEVRRLYFDLA